MCDTTNSSARADDDGNHDEGNDDNGNEDEIDQVPGGTCVAEQPLPSAKVLGAQFILKTRDGKKLTQVAMDGIIADTKVVLKSTLQKVGKKLMERIGPTITDVLKEELKSVFSDESIANPFHGLDTQHRQQKFIQEHFNYVVANI